MYVCVCVCVCVWPWPCKMKIQLLLALPCGQARTDSVEIWKVTEVMVFLFCAGNGGKWSRRIADVRQTHQSSKPRIISFDTSFSNRPQMAALPLLFSPSLALFFLPLTKTSSSSFFSEWGGLYRRGNQPGTVSASRTRQIRNCSGLFFFPKRYSPDIVPPFTVTDKQKKTHKPPRKTTRTPFHSTGADA